jgi:hypothetical protein
LFWHRETCSSWKPLAHINKPTTKTNEMENTTSDNYEPFGAEWEKELMKLRKRDIIDMLRRSAKANHATQDAAAHRIATLCGAIRKTGHGAPGGMPCPPEREVCKALKPPDSESNAD